MKAGDLVRDDAGKVRYVYVRAGCATSMKNCKHGEHATTVQPLDTRGMERPGGTVCLDGRGLSPWFCQCGCRASAPCSCNTRCERMHG